MQSPLILVYPLACNSEVAPEVQDCLGARIALLHAGVPFSFNETSHGHRFLKRTESLPGYLHLELKLGDGPNPSGYMLSFHSHLIEEYGLTGFGWHNSADEKTDPEKALGFYAVSRIPFAHRERFSEFVQLFLDALFCFLFSAPVTAPFRASLANPDVFRKMATKATADLGVCQMRVWKSRGASHHDLLVAQPWIEARISEIDLRTERMLQTLKADPSSTPAFGEADEAQKVRRP